MYIATDRRAIMTTDELKKRGYTCRLETVEGQGYLGGDGTECYRVRDPMRMLVSPLSTYRCARLAWRDAAQTIAWRARQVA